MTRACPAATDPILTRLCERALLSVAAILPVAAAWPAPCLAGDDPPRAALEVTPGAGGIVEMPLKRTSVRTEISGFVARVVVEQVFANPIVVAIEARYVFSLSERGAVDGFVMTVGERRIEGVIRGRDEAAEVHREAREAGHAAELLEQERPPSAAVVFILGITTKGRWLSANGRLTTSAESCSARTIWTAPSRFSDSTPRSFPIPPTLGTACPRSS